MSLGNDILQLADDTTCAVERQWLDRAMAEAPYCTLPMLLYLERNGTTGNDDLLARLAILSPDRQALALRLGRDVEKFRNFYPAAPQTPTPATDDAIDRFLDNYGTGTSQREIEVLSQAIFNPQPDYADILAAQEKNDKQPHGDNSSGDAQDRLIDNFIADAQEREQRLADEATQQHVDSNEAAAVATTPVNEPDQPKAGMLTEGLAQLYIARGKYDRALEIIKALNLKFPEKSVYFATQIRFLKKLMLNEKYLNNNK